MSRQYSNKKGRSAQFSTPRTNTKAHPDETYQDTPLKRKGGSGRKAITLAKSRRSKKAAVTMSDQESTTDGESADDEADEEEDDDNDDEDPEVHAPSHGAMHVAGHYQYHEKDDDVSEEEPMFEVDTIEGEDFDPATAARGSVNEDDFFAEDQDDHVYQGAAEITDSEPESSDEREMEKEEQRIKRELALSTGEDDNDDDPSFDLNYIEGLSAYGFGDSDSEESLDFSQFSHSSEGETETMPRRVRFEEAFPTARVATLSESPTMTRSLLPSALPSGIPAYDGGTTSEADDYDSDVTDVDLPEEAVLMLAEEQDEEQQQQQKDEPEITGGMKKPSTTQASSGTASSLKRSPQTVKGPRRGTFLDDGAKSAGILDATGKRLIITNPQHLGEQFAQRYGQSAPSSPGLSFAEAVFNSTNNVADGTTPIVPDPMIASLNADTTLSSNGQAVGPPHAFFPTMGIDNDVALQFAMMADEEGSDIGGLDHAEAQMRIEDVIQFDADTDDESPTSPLFLSSDFTATPRNGVSHLNNTNITAFRRNADPNFAALFSSPIAPAYGNMNTPKPRSRKRKAVQQSPYNHAHYDGVTPVRRMTQDHQEMLDSSPAPSKRQRLMI